MIPTCATRAIAVGDALFGSLKINNWLSGFAFKTLENMFKEADAELYRAKQTRDSIAKRGYMPLPLAA